MVHCGEKVRYHTVWRKSEDSAADAESEKHNSLVWFLLREDSSFNVAFASIEFKHFRFLELFSVANITYFK